MIIGSAAHFKLCSCGQHGHIRLANGTDGPEVCDKESALAAMQVAVTEGWVIKEEAMILREQIHASSLPRTREDANPLLDLVMELKNQVRCDHEDRIEELARKITSPGYSATVH